MNIAGLLELEGAGRARPCAAVRPPLGMTAFDATDRVYLLHAAIEIGNRPARGPHTRNRQDQGLAHGGSIGRGDSAGLGNLGELTEADCAKNRQGASRRIPYPARMHTRPVALITG